MPTEVPQAGSGGTETWWGEVDTQCPGKGSYGLGKAFRGRLATTWPRRVMHRGGKGAVAGSRRQAWKPTTVLKHFTS